MTNEVFSTSSTNRKQKNKKPSKKPTNSVPLSFTLKLTTGNLIKRLDDSESDFLAHLQQERSKEEREKKRVEGEQVDAFKKSFPLPISLAFLVR